MEDLIRRSDAIKSVLGLTMLQGRVPIDTVIFQINNIPAVEPCEDAPSIDIVRCKECKHCSLDVCVERTVSGKERCINICNRHSIEWVVDKEWFCADGERRE